MASYPIESTRLKCHHHSQKDGFVIMQWIPLQQHFPHEKPNSILFCTMFGNDTQERAITNGYYAQERWQKCYTLIVTKARVRLMGQLLKTFLIKRQMAILHIPSTNKVNNK